MALEEIRKDIESTARAEASKISKDADAEARRIVAEAKDKADATLKTADTAARSESERLVKEHQAGMDIETHNMALAARQEVVNRELKRIKGAVARKIEESHMNALIKAAMQKFSESVPAHEMVLTTSKKNMKFIESLKPKCEVRYEDVDGVELRSKDSKVTLNVTSEMVADSYEDAIRSVMSSVLFGAEQRKEEKQRAAQQQKASKPKAKRAAKPAKKMPAKKAAPKAKKESKGKKR